MRMPSGPAFGTTNPCRNEPHQEYAGVPCAANPATPAPLLWMNAAPSAPQSLADPAWIHITPSQTRIAVQARAASFELLSDSHTWMWERLAGLQTTALIEVTMVR